MNDENFEEPKEGEEGLVLEVEDIDVEDLEPDEELVEEPEEEVVPEPKPEVKKKSKRERVYTYFAKYIGKHKDIRLSGIGRIYIGKEFEVSENVANALRLDENFEVRKSYTYVEV